MTFKLYDCRVGYVVTGASRQLLPGGGNSVDGWLNSFIKDLGAGNGSWISLLLAFAILPWFYLKYAFEAQKEYVDLAKAIFSNDSLNRLDKRKLGEWSERSLHVFQLEWGLVCAIAVLILANFCSVLVVDLSALARDSCMAAAKDPAGQSGTTCGKVKLLLSIYSIGTALVIFFEILWARVAAIRRLRERYFEQALNQSRAQPANSVNGRQADRAQLVPNRLRLSKER
jgi:hypothetical protein